MSLITSRQIASSATRAKALSESRLEAGLARQHQQQRLELDLITQANVCPMESLPDLQRRLAGLKPEEMKALIKNNFYDPAILQSALCIMGAMVYMQPDLPGTITPNERLREWFTQLKRVGTESTAGYAFQADMKNANNVFIVKTSQNPATDDLQHELFVGLFGLNQLRSTKSGVPVYNFAYIFGGFKCSPPIVNLQDKKAVAWCNNLKDTVNYVLYENIVPSISMREYVATCTPEQFLNIYLQVMYALRKAHRVADFSHNDLHDENVLVRTITGSAPFQILYETELGTEYILADRLATLIDYGYSHIQYRHRHYSVQYFEELGIDPNASFPMYDAYKLLLMSMRTMLDKGNRPAFDMAAQILHFFNQEERPEEVVTRQSESLYHLPNLPALMNVTFDQLTRYIRSQCSCPFIRDRPGPERILGCQGTDVCLLEMPTLPGITPTDIFTFYDGLTNLQAAGLSTSDLRQKFNYTQAKPQFQTIIQQRLETFKNETDSLLRFPLHQQSLNVITTPAYLELYRQYVTKVAQIFDLGQWLQLHLQIGIYVAQLYSDPLMEGQWKGYLQQIQTYRRQTFMEVVESLQQDIRFLNSVQTQPEVMARVKAAPELEWYWTGLPVFEYMLGV
jgi:hypothetical protein